MLSRFAMPLLSHANGFARGFALGIALGFLPCGFLMGRWPRLRERQAGDWRRRDVCIRSRDRAEPFAVALIGEGAGRRWRSIVVRFAPAAFTLNALLLVVDGVASSGLIFARRPNC